MALSQPQLEELKRFKFYVSRRLEDGRERFRLHMGHFATLQEAEEWLGVVREVYPGAWAGEAPGKRLRERAAAESARAAESAAAPVIARPAPASPPRAEARVPPADSIPTLSAAPEEARSSAPVTAEPSRPAPRGAEPSHATATAAPASTIKSSSAASPPSHGMKVTVTARPAPAPSEPARAAPAAAKPTPRVVVRTPPQSTHAAHSGALNRAASERGALLSQGLPAPPSARASTAPATSADSLPPLSHSNVRAVIASLDETGSTRELPQPPAAQKAPTPPAAQKPPRPPAAQTLSAPPAAQKVAAPTAVQKAPSVPAARKGSAAPSAQKASTPGAGLSDSQVLRILENRRSDGARLDDEDTSITMLRPDDTGTREALKTAVEQNVPVSFAVQLQWSVQAIDLMKVPPLAIFSAYTLYTVEGSREGRRWFGLRLGFFSDAISAKQVAQYVRSEFASVAVVPVSPKERTRATQSEQAAASSPPSARVRERLPDQTAEFKLIDDVPGPTLPVRSAATAVAKPETTAPAKVTAPPGAAVKPPSPAIKVSVSANPVASRSPATASTPAAAAEAPEPGAAARRPVRPGGRRVRANERRSPKTLEETLEILGADQLQIDDGRGEALHASGARAPVRAPRKNSPFTKLLDRLAERTRRDR
ncbi:MAG TPA: hypothetical protein VME21_05595 [Steroidobacteraceae bacterium]|nr:hypothetical protein [Steroidobacteraceae bacterium]